MKQSMNETTYSYTSAVNMSYEEAIKKTTTVLKEEGFGILTRIDVKAKMKEKLDKEMEDYVILGSCNPTLAFQALQVETEIGLMLPCNVIVYVKDGQTHVAAIRPGAAMGMIDNAHLAELAKKVEEKLKNVINQL